MSKSATGHQDTHRPARPKSLTDYQQALAWPRETAEKYLAILLANGDDRHAFIRSYKDHYGENIIHDVALSDYPDHLQKLIDGGVNPHLKGMHGRTALHAAAQAGKTHACAILLQAGLDPEQPDAIGSSAIRLARTHGQQDVLTLFEAHQAVKTIERIRLSRPSP